MANGLSVSLAHIGVHVRYHRTIFDSRRAFGGGQSRVLSMTRLLLRPVLSELRAYVWFCSIGCVWGVQ